MDSANRFAADMWQYLYGNGGSDVHNRTQVEIFSRAWVDPNKLDDSCNQTYYSKNSQDLNVTLADGSFSSMVLQCTLQYPPFLGYCASYRAVQQRVLSWI